ncbi:MULTISPECIES: hypothetical protein [unclassified Variovorax]|uniref:hypothetical protein n=1 Tax=unclassified Variovorax TaxID=663243 RepID=UPI000837CDF0|nr:MULTISPECIES: hypothetical protein [unclassified Variovorax]
MTLDQPDGSQAVMMMITAGFSQRRPFGYRTGQLQGKLTEIEDDAFPSPLTSEGHCLGLVMQGRAAFCVGGFAREIGIRQVRVDVLWYARDHSTCLSLQLTSSTAGKTWATDLRRTHGCDSEK